MIFLKKCEKRIREVAPIHNHFPKKRQGWAPVGFLKLKWISGPGRSPRKSRFKSLAPTTVKTSLVFCSFPFGHF